MAAEREAAAAFGEQAPILDKALADVRGKEWTLVALIVCLDWRQLSAIKGALANDDGSCEEACAEAFEAACKQVIAEAAAILDAWHAKAALAA